jgi:hypothetical protein
MNIQPLTPQSAGITGPMNINAVITHLIEMTPGQRKQFAQMHMDDPMMLSAAKFVDNQISKQAAAMSAQQTGAAPPPVNQQVVAQMSPQPPAPQAAPQPQAGPQDQGQAQPMPEDAGIAQLPAQNMPSEYAAGGIVAFGDGGTTNALGQEIDPKTGYPVPVYRRILNALDESPGYQRYREMVDNPYGSTGNSGPRPRNAQRTEPAATSAAPAAPAVPPVRKEDKVVKAPPEAANKKTGIDQLRADRVASATPPSESQPAAASPDYGTMYSDILKAQPDARASLPKEIGEIETLEKEQGNRELESVKKREQGLQALTAKREERLAKREQALSQEEGLNPYMAMINAGLAMMQSTGKGLAGIAAGAEKGMGQFAEGVKLNTAQRQKINDARDALDDLRFNQETMSEKDRNDAYNRIKQGAVATRTATVSYIQNRDEVNAKTAGHIFDANTRQVLEGQRQQFEKGLQGQREASQERLTKMQMDNAIRAAGISASAPLATKLAFLEKIGAAPEDSALYKGYLLTEQADKEPRMYEAYTKQLADPYGGADFLKRNPTFEAYKAGMSSKGGGGTMPNPGWKNLTVK